MDHVIAQKLLEHVRGLKNSEFKDAIDEAAPKAMTKGISLWDLLVAALEGFRAGGLAGAIAAIEELLAGASGPEKHAHIKKKDA